MNYDILSLIGTGLIHRPIANHNYSFILLLQTSYLCYSYNTGMRALPDIYARRPRVQCQASAYISGKAQVPVL